MIPKENVVIFPARIAPEKQPEIVKELEHRIPEFEFVFCCEQNMSKEEYWYHMARAKIMISTSLQETFGITQFEALAAGNVPLVPDHLCYSEEYADDPQFLYPSKWITGKDKDYAQLEEFLRNAMANYEKFNRTFNSVIDFHKKNYTGCDILVEVIKSI
jgi:glycosyltransferase involved in cell wall biosynthesis